MNQNYLTNCYILLFINNNPVKKDESAAFVDFKQIPGSV